MTSEEAIMILKNEQPHCGKRALFPEEKKYEAYEVAVKALKQIETIKEIINSPLYIQEDVLRYKMICKVFESEDKG